MDRKIWLTMAILICSSRSTSAQVSDLSACKSGIATVVCRMNQALLNGGPRADGRITIFNNTGSTIYKIFAWPEELNARTFNVLPFPIVTGTSTELNIDNAYGDCVFYFQYDRNDPLKAKKIGSRRQPLKAIRAEVCGIKPYVWIGPGGDNDQTQK